MRGCFITNDYSSRRKSKDPFTLSRTRRKDSGEPGSFQVFKYNKTVNVSEKDSKHTHLAGLILFIKVTLKNWIQKLKMKHFWQENLNSDHKDLHQRRRGSPSENHRRAELEDILQTRSWTSHQSRRTTQRPATLQQNTFIDAPATESLINRCTQLWVRTATDANQWEEEEMWPASHRSGGVRTASCLDRRRAFLNLSSSGVWRTQQRISSLTGGSRLLSSV